MPDDAVQEAFIDLAKSHVAPDCPKSWLFTTTRRKAQNIARSEQRRRTHHRAAAEQLPGQDGYNNWFRSTGSVQLVAEDAAQGLETLEADERELLVARIWGDLSFEQLAELLDCSVSSAHRRYSAALQRLKAAMNAGLDSHSSNQAPNKNRQETLPALAKFAPQARLADGELQ
jgi:RNA polymerase sigma-70 factor (ECF subfamily)